jgi:uncharacterized protein with von Willebrand factor type A (vWA) domain
MRLGIHNYTKFIARINKRRKNTLCHNNLHGIISELAAWLRQGEISERNVVHNARGHQRQ